MQFSPPQPLNSPQASVSFYHEIEGTKLTPGAFLFLLMLQPKQLQEFLNRVEALRGVMVGYESPEKEAIAPHVVMLSGLVNIHGTPHLFETELNLAEFHTQDDLMLLAKRMIAAFEKAGVEVKT